ncbi:DUF4197 family protein [Erythrobacter sp. 3-20A1M]|uniref:DUF4197 domain-containing protein n=1 Tax=Erythrobacter sp. 3-20A1M TaxID=2653850 RepID=UPI001BFCC919|nr:DUF4197 domain-containing protein [Erythrobacter sp. 3-20A1M]QWC56039.1 DUF4197 family protein [Erythrobacter sp. 3-20A1M]
MTGLLTKATQRRAFMGGAMTATGGLLLAGCATSPFGRYGLTDAVRELLFLSSDRAFARLTAPGGFWDKQVATVGLDRLLGARGNVLASILTSALFKARLQDAFAQFALDASARAAPVVTDAVRVIGIRGAVDLITGGPTAATSFLRADLGNGLIEAMVPELAQAMRVSREPLVDRALSSLTGVDVAGVANRVAGSVNDAIWTEIGREEAAIRADPASTRNPAIIAVFGGAQAL